MKPKSRMDDAGLKKIKQAYVAAKKKLASIRAKRSRVIKKDVAAADELNLAHIRSKMGKL